MRESRTAVNIREIEDKTLQVMPAPAGTFAVFRDEDGKEWRETVHVLGLVEAMDGARGIAPMLPIYADTCTWLTPATELNCPALLRLEFPGPSVALSDPKPDGNEGGKRE